VNRDYKDAALPNESVCLATALNWRRPNCSTVGEEQLKAMKMIAQTQTTLLIYILTSKRFEICRQLLSSLSLCLCETGVNTTFRVLDFLT